MQAALAIMTDQTQEPIYNKASNDDVKVELIVNERAEAMIFHNKPFNHDVSWFEFNLENNQMDFIMDEGATKPLGIPVDPKLAKHLQNSFQVLLVRMDDVTGEPVKGDYFPLIVHRT